MPEALSNISNGETVIVRDIEESHLKIKLMEMGFFVGKKIHVLFRAPLGDPMAVDVEGYTLSLRLEEADLIIVEPDTASAP